MKYKKYIIIFLCLIVTGSYFFIKNRKENISPAIGRTEENKINNRASSNDKPEDSPQNINGSSTSSSSEDGKPKKLDITLVDTIPNKVGNTSGNLQNMGFAAQQGRWMYYWLPNTLYRAMPDGETGLKFLDEKSQMYFINVVGEWIYYLNLVERTIYKIKTDGTDKTKIINSDIMNMLVTDDSIYYTSLEGIVRIDLDGKNKRIITSDRALNAVTLVSDTLYYTRFSESSQHLEICKINIDGTNKTTISKDQCQKMIVQGDWIYYINYSDGGRLYKIKTDGTNKMKLTISTIETFNVSEDTIYFVPSFDLQNLYKTSTGGGKVSTMTQNPTINSSLSGNKRIALLQINIIGDNIFCSCSTPDGLLILRVALDGSVVKFLN